MVQPVFDVPQAEENLWMRSMRAPASRNYLCLGREDVAGPENVMSHMEIIVGCLRGPGMSPRSSLIRFSGQVKFV